MNIRTFITMTLVGGAAGFATSFIVTRKILIPRLERQLNTAVCLTTH